MLSQIPSKLDIVTSHLRIKDYVKKTPILFSEEINDKTGAEVIFKCENLQKIGAFKARGGINAALSMSGEDLQK